MVQRLVTFRFKTVDRISSGDVTILFIAIMGRSDEKHISV
jgi:hypothetical protein